MRDNPVVHPVSSRRQASPKVRVLHVFDHSIPLQSGYSFRSRAILEHQRALGWDTFQVTGPKQGSTETLEQEVGELMFYRTAQPSGLMARLPMLRQVAVISALAKRLRGLVDKIRPNIVHAHSPALNGAAALRIARASGIPLVYEVRAFWEDAAVDHGTSTERGPRYLAARALETYVLKRADAVVTICEGLRREILQRGLPEGRVSIVPNSVDLSHFGGARESRDMRSELGLAGKTVLGFIGSFYAYEGLGLLLRALPGVVEGIPEARLLLVGGGPSDGDLRKLTAELGIEDRVIFTGRVPHDQIPSYYDAIDVLVYPRLRMRLTDLVTPLKPLEAMARGRLVVASDVGGHRELVQHDNTGYLFRAGDADNLTSTVVELLRDRSSWARVRDSAKRFILTERSWTVGVERYRLIYEALSR
jgi:PEP-CTERM/exosortase A-associated glycosyltransferase